MKKKRKRTKGRMKICKLYLQSNSKGNKLKFGNNSRRDSERHSGNNSTATRVLRCNSNNPSIKMAVQVLVDKDNLVYAPEDKMEDANMIVAKAGLKEVTVARVSVVLGI